MKVNIRQYFSVILGLATFLLKCCVVVKIILFNPVIRKYVFSNPLVLLSEKYDSVVANALYGKARDFIRSENVEILTIEDYLLKHNLTIKKENIVVPIIGGFYSISIFETQALCMLIRGIDARRVLEIGTMVGKTAVNIAHNLPEDGHVYTLDLPEQRCKHDLGKYVRENEDVSHKITLLCGDSREFDFSPYYDDVDLMFIDGNHTYEYVLSDSENAVRCVRSGGFIVWHDFDYTQLASTTAIIEVCNEHGLCLACIDSTKLAIAKNINDFRARQKREV